MAVIKGSALNRFLLLIAVSYIAGFCLSVGFLCVVGIISIPNAYRMGVLLSMPVTGAVALCACGLLLLDPAKAVADEGEGPLR